MVSAIRIWNYGDYSSKNYGSSRAVQIGSLTLYFSYDTVVAFKDGINLIVSENCWSTTTGRHLNCIDGGRKKDRLPRDKFEAELEKVLTAHGLTV